MTITPIIILAAASIIFMLAICIIMLVFMAFIMVRRDRIGDLWKARYVAMKNAHLRDYNTARFLHELLLDLVTPSNDQVILYKARCLHVALLMLDLDEQPQETMDHIREIFNMPTSKTIDAAVNKLLAKANAKQILEDSTADAHDQFIQLLERLDEEDKKFCEKIQEAQRQLIGKKTAENCEVYPDGTKLISINRTW